jgi:hypothetical protein
MHALLLTSSYLAPPNGKRSAPGDQFKAAADGGAFTKIRPPAAAAIPNSPVCCNACEPASRRNADDKRLEERLIAPLDANEARSGQQLE